MALREVVCATGHRTEVLMRGPTAPVPACSCGQATSFNPVSLIATGYKGKWGGDYNMPHDVRDAIDQSVGWKQELLTEREEATQNGFRL